MLTTKMIHLVYGLKLDLELKEKWKYHVRSMYEVPCTASRFFSRIQDVSN